MMISASLRAAKVLPGGMGAGKRPAPRLRAVRVEAFVEKKLEPPVIDAEEFLSEKRRGHPPAKVAQQIAEAGSEFGCFQLVNHGLRPELDESLQREARAFFALPLEKKLSVERTAQNPWGFTNAEFTKQTLDLKEIYDFAHEVDEHLPGFAARNQWPAGEEEFKRTMLAYLSEMTRVSFKLLEAFSIGLGLPANTLFPVFEGPHTSFMRLNYYPTTPKKEEGLGLNHHTDAGFLTILKQDIKVHGLEFFKDGAWHRVTPAPDALTINVGDQAQVLSNDILKAPLHRVLSPHNGQGRYSAPFFFNPRADAVIEPLPAFVTKERPQVYRAIPWKEFREMRFAGDYADLGEEIQIHHYKIQ